MSPLEARRAVGQPDLVERLNGELAMSAFASASSMYLEMDAQRRDAAAEIDRLRAIISRVRHLTAYTDAEWAMGEIRELMEETR
jgi:hypothetical protein